MLTFPHSVCPGYCFSPYSTLYWLLNNIYMDWSEEVIEYQLSVPKKHLLRSYLQQLPGWYCYSWFPCRYWGLLCQTCQLNPHIKHFKRDLRKDRRRVQLKYTSLGTVTSSFWGSGTHEVQMEKVKNWVNFSRSSVPSKSHLSKEKYPGNHKRSKKKKGKKENSTTCTPVINISVYDTSTLCVNAVSVKLINSTVINV